MIPTYAEVKAQAASVGLAACGALHLCAADGVPATRAGPATTLVLLGFEGSRQWPAFASSPEAQDGAAHALDRWSRRIIDDLARRFDALALYPFKGPPWWPFQQWARRAQRLEASPLGMLMHPRLGTWHAWRGALALAPLLDIPAAFSTPHPCARCDAKPCLSACPAQAVTEAGIDLPRCMSHLRSPEGATCRERGCLARAACPVGVEHRYEPPQLRFHMDAYVRAITR